MEILVRNVPPEATERSLRGLISSSMREAEVDAVFVVRRRREPGVAVLTVSDQEQGEKFLGRYGSEPDASTAQAPPHREQLQIGGRAIFAFRGKYDPDRILLATLRKEAKDRLGFMKALNPPEPKRYHSDKTLPFTAFSYGHWDYAGPKLQFWSQETIKGPGTLRFGTAMLILESKPPQIQLRFPTADTGFQLEFMYRAVQSVAWKSKGTPSVTLTLSEAPRIYQKRSQPFNFSNASGNAKAIGPQWDRLAGLTEKQKLFGGSCLVYHIGLPKESLDSRFLAIFRTTPKLPRHIPWRTVTVTASSLDPQLNNLKAQIAKRYAHFDFLVRFQIQRLAQNGYLTPTQVLAILPVIDEALETTHSHTCPSNDFTEFGPDKLADNLQRNILLSERESLYNHDKMRKHPGIRLIHRVLITPTGMYLEGPEQESINRVIRQHPEKIDHFLRVIFSDEDFDRLQFSRSLTMASVFYKKFRNHLDNGVEVAGRKFEFLGFSSSSLKTQSVWFMAPIDVDGTFITARAVVAGLGDFSEIYCPAKCAARIGQAFTDTSYAIKVDPACVSTVPDIERNGRCFLDAVGTISADLLEKMWVAQPGARHLQPKLYQIRYAGAKGMIALDSRLKGEVLRLRPSMIKFTGSNMADLEVCGSSTKPLPLYLNRQYITLFEDLGVPEEVFLELQDEAIKSLQRVTQSAINASAFLEYEQVSKATGSPALIRHLYYDGFDFREDSFLRGILEIATLARLREIKYRARILIKNGKGLYGIMDETGILEEGQIYCSSQGQIIAGRVIVTRAPALHPGDAQMVTAVDVPDDSPLKLLDNCVVFSQHGERDLPSQLSGGDLDGDQYGVIWDERLLLPETRIAADYPRVPAKEIGRAITKKDTTEFFLDFLGNDHLGRIALLHVQLADSLGSQHASCLKLAEMHSTAVDFAKTGVPVDMAEGPRYMAGRPDFMAPSPRAVLQNYSALLGPEELLNGIGTEVAEGEALDPSARERRYCESTRAMGKMYRTIDERQFLDQMHARNQSIEEEHRAEPPLILRLWEHVQREVAGVEWSGLRDWALDVKERYESQLLETIFQYSISPSETITELEVFIGTILGRDGAMTSRRVREVNQNMKEKFTNDVMMTINSIRNGYDEDGEEQPGSMERAMACFAAAVEQHSDLKLREMQKQLESFLYVAAGVCLAELHKRRADEYAWKRGPVTATDHSTELPPPKND